jgi:ParB/RepB/Spo0J family partition protein
MTKTEARSGVEPKFMRIPVAQIDAGKNVRLDDDDGLIPSIAKWGVLQPISVVPSATPGRVECMFGHRRLAAARRVGLETIPALGYPRATDQSRMLMQIAENRDRQPMSILEEAIAFHDLKETGMTTEGIARAVGVSLPTVSDKLKLLAYPDPIRMAVHHKQVSLTDALSIPITLARATPEEQLRTIVRMGGHGVREWIRSQATAENGHVRTRIGGSTLGCDSDTADLIRALARGRRESVAAWLRRIAEAEKEKIR